LKQLLEKNKTKPETANTETPESLRTLIDKQLEEIGQLKASLNELQTLSQQEIVSLKFELQRVSRRSPSTGSGSPTSISDQRSLETLVEQKQKTIDGLTGVLNLTSAQLENEKYNNEVIVQTLRADIYNKDLQIGEFLCSNNEFNDGLIL